MNTRERQECVEHALREMMRLLDDVQGKKKLEDRVGTICDKLYTLQFILEAEGERK